MVFVSERGLIPAARRTVPKDLAKVKPEPGALVAGIDTPLVNRDPATEASQSAIASITYNLIFARKSEDLYFCAIISCHIRLFNPVSRTGKLTECTQAQESPLYLALQA
jgi:hypothetical protein